MKTIKTIILFSFLFFAFACEEDDTNDLSTPERLEGRWIVDEEDHLKNLKQTYRVYIDINPFDESQILIDNFYGLDTDSVYANISGMTVYVPEQETGGFLIYGTATISSNYKKLTWVYQVDDGSGIWSEVNAVFTKDDSY